jgi:hypothetical protein
MPEINNAKNYWESWIDRKDLLIKNTAMKLWNSQINVVVVGAWWSNFGDACQIGVGKSELLIKDVLIFITLIDSL